LTGCASVQKELGAAADYVKQMNVDVFGVPARDLLRGPNTKLYQTAAAPKSDAPSWWSENWPWVVGGLVVVGGVLGGLAASGQFSGSDRRIVGFNPDGTPIFQGGD
jgi:hypothetical protein